MLHLSRVLIAERSQALEQRIARQFLTEAQGERSARKLRRTKPLLCRRPDIREHNDRLMAQEPGENVHPLCRTLEPLCCTGCSEIDAIQLGQFVDIRLRQERCQILLPRAQRFAPARHNGEWARGAVIGSSDGSVLHGAGKAVRKDLLWLPAQ